jgi:hypothetical protein
MGQRSDLQQMDASMRNKGPVQSDSRAIFGRLESRGINYVKIKQLISFDLPHAALYFESQFGSHTPPQVLRQTSRWRQLLKNDFILSADLRREVEKILGGADIFAWNALIETGFPKLCPWNLSRTFVPTHKDPEARYILPDIRIVAIHEETQETRTAVIPGGKNSAAAWGSAWRTAFAELGLLDLVFKQRWRKRLVSARHSQGWPIFTKVVIPRLYDFMAPFYRMRGHIWSEKEPALTRNAFFPKVLLDDMREILQIEHSDVFPHLTLGQLKAAVQRHISNTRKGTKSKR